MIDLSHVVILASEAELKIPICVSIQDGWGDPWGVARWVTESAFVAQEGGGGSGLLTMLPTILIGLVAFYMLIILPQRKQEKTRKEMLANLKKNDHVITMGGIYGVVVNVRPEIDEVTLRIDENSNLKIRVTQAAIVRVTAGENATEESSK